MKRYIANGYFLYAIKACCALILMSVFILSPVILQASESDHRITKMMIGEWTISGAVDENIKGTGNVKFSPSGLADYWVEIYLNDYLLDRIESVFSWTVYSQYLQMNESEMAEGDPYGLRARARKEPVKVIAVNDTQLILQTENYGVLVLHRSEN